MRDLMAMAGICFALAAASFFGFLLAVTNERVLRLDGLLLTLISSLLTGIFSFNVIWLVRKTPLGHALAERFGHLAKFRPRAAGKAQAVEVPHGEEAKSSQP